MNNKLNKTITKVETDKALLEDGLNKAMSGMNRAFKMLEEISVRRENVDLMASAKQELRLVFAQLKKTAQEIAAGQERRCATAAGQNGGVSEEGLCPTGDMKSERGPHEALPSGEETDETAEHGVCR